MLVSVRTRRVFRQKAENDNVPAVRRRLAGLATLFAILVTSCALVLVHSVAAWWQPGWRGAADLVRPAGAHDLGAHPLHHLAAARELGGPSGDAPRPGR